VGAGAQHSGTAGVPRRRVRGAGSGPAQQRSWPGAAARGPSGKEGEQGGGGDGDSDGGSPAPAPSWERRASFTRLGGDEEEPASSPSSLDEADSSSDMAGPAGTTSPAANSGAASGGIARSGVGPGGGGVTAAGGTAPLLEARKRARLQQQAATQEGEGWADGGEASIGRGPDAADAAAPPASGRRARRSSSAGGGGSVAGSASASSTSGRRRSKSSSAGGAAAAAAPPSPAPEGLRPVPDSVMAARRAANPRDNNPALAAAIDPDSVAYD
jgi:hypothetical protein